MALKINQILIVVPRYIPCKEKAYYEFPLGLAYISACLKQAGYVVDVLNLNHYDGKDIDLIEHKMSGNGYQYVLTGGLSAHYKQLKAIVADVRKSDSNAVVIVGGGVMSATPQLMYDFIQPDYMILGEGEITILELIDELDNGGKNLRQVKGIGYHTRSGELMVTPRREPIMDLDSLPWPDLEGFEFERYLAMQRPNDNLYLYIDDEPRFYPIISSRGCPYNCTFCYHPLGQKYRSRSIDNFMQEVQYVTEKYNVNNLAIFDELLSANRKRLFEICDRLKNLPRKVHWMCQLRVDQIDEEMLSKMKEAGCFLISYGFESASDIVLKSMKKHITKAQIEKALVLTRKAGIGIQGYFIFGDSEETKKTAYETLDFWKKHRDYHITLGYIRPYPGSELWERQKTNGHLNSASDELRFLEQCVSSPPNLSKMNEDEWFEFERDIQKAIILNGHFGELLSGHKNVENNYSITIRCPHCKQVVTYNNFHQRILGVFKLACRNCNQAMNMTSLAFESVRDNYERNQRVFKKIKNNDVPVTVIPCMSEAEFAAMADIALEGVNIQIFMDLSDEKVNKIYMGKKVLKQNAENINAISREHYFLIPLTRFANRIFSYLVSVGVDENRICRLDEAIVGPKENWEKAYVQK